VVVVVVVLVVVIIVPSAKLSIDSQNIFRIELRRIEVVQWKFYCGMFFCREFCWFMT